MTFKIPPKKKRIEMRLCEDESGGLYVQSQRSGVALCALQGVLGLGWVIVTISPAERALLAAHGFKVSQKGAAKPKSWQGGPGGRPSPPTSDG